MTDTLQPLTSAELADLKAKAKADLADDFTHQEIPVAIILRLIGMIERRDTALTVICDMPIPEQDNMIAANMREIACKALAATEPGR